MRDFTVNITQPYKKSPNAKFLLIANNETSTDQIAAWREAINFFGSDLDVLDLSYYGFLDLANKINAKHSLLNQWRGMTFIIANNTFENNNMETAGKKLLAKQQFLEACMEYDINFYIIGGANVGGSHILDKAIIPSDGGY